MTGTSGDHRPSGAAAAQMPSAGGGRGGSGEQPERPAVSQPSRLFGLRRPSCQRLGDSTAPGPRPRSPAPVCFPHRRRLLIWARQLQQRLQRRCAKPGRSGESRRRGCGGRVDSGEEASAEPGEGPRVLHRCGLRAGAARCGRIPQRTPAAEGLTVTHSYPTFIPLHPSKRPTTATTLKFTS